MAESVGPVLAIGAVTFVNRSVLHTAPPSWRLPLATGLLAVVAAGAERINPTLVAGIAWIALVATLITPAGGYDAPLVSLARVAGVNTAGLGIKPQPNRGAPAPSPRGTTLA